MFGIRHEFIIMNKSNYLPKCLQSTVNYEPISQSCIISIHTIAVRWGTHLDLISRNLPLKCSMECHHHTAKIPSSLCLLIFVEHKAFLSVHFQHLTLKPGHFHSDNLFFAEPFWLVVFSSPQTENYLRNYSCHLLFYPAWLLKNILYLCRFINKFRG
jgi:hypothetical protein